MSALRQLNHGEKRGKLYRMMQDEAALRTLYVKTCRDARFGPYSSAADNLSDKLAALETAIDQAQAEIGERWDGKEWVAFDPFEDER